MMDDATTGSTQYSQRTPASDGTTQHDLDPLRITPGSLANETTNSVANFFITTTNDKNAPNVFGGGPAADDSVDHDDEEEEEEDDDLVSISDDPEAMALPLEDDADDNDEDYPDDDDEAGEDDDDSYYFDDDLENVSNRQQQPLLQGISNSNNNNNNNNRWINSITSITDEEQGLRSRDFGHGANSSSSSPSNNNKNSNSPTGSTIPLRIKAHQDIEIRVQPSDTIATMKAAVRRGLGTAPTAYVRLIAAGRLLAPDTARVQDFHPTIQPHTVIHAVITNPSTKLGAQALVASGLGGTTSTAQRRAVRGSGVNAQGWAVRRATNEYGGEDGDDADDDDDTLESYTGNAAGGGGRSTERLGFDRLRDSVGFRRSEVASIRAYFNRSIDRWIRDHPDLADQAANGESDLVRRRLLQEEAWMQAQGPASEFRLNLTGIGSNGGSSGTDLTSLGQLRGGTVGTDRDFMWGFLLGFFVGFLMLLWVWMPTVPHKQKLGILTGISVQVALGMLQKKDEYGVDDLVLSDY